MVMGELALETDVLVVGGGPGGYSAAFRAADLGREVTLVNIDPRPGGECLFRGCIPSKTLLYLAELIHDARHAPAVGLTFGAPRIDLEAVRAWKQKVIDKLAAGLVSLSERRGVQLVQGRAVFEGSTSVRVHGGDVSRIKFKRAVLAVGSHPTPIPGVTVKPGGRVMDSTGALALAEIPESLLVVGGGYSGLELGSVYAALGSRVHLVEMAERILPGADTDLVEPLFRRLQENFAALHFKTRVVSVAEDDDGVDVRLEGPSAPQSQRFDRVLIAIGRRPTSRGIGLEHTRVQMDDQGFVRVDEQQQTADAHVLAVGDIVGGVMLAHKAMREGQVAAEVIAGEASAFDARAIPAVVYTDPQVAWAGLTETEARRQKRPVRVERFPWKFSGRATTMDAGDGMTKVLIDPETERILGVGIVGRGTEGLISEGVLAVEMGALAQDMALSIHPHPTLSETMGEAAEVFLGSAIHMVSRKKTAKM